MAADTQNPTNSKGYAILETMQGALIDQVDNATLADALEESLTSLETTEANFTKAADSMAPHVKEACEGLLEAAHGFFEQIRTALGWAKGYLNSGDKEALSTASNTIQRSNFQLDLLFVHLRNTAWSMQGPTDIPNLNALIWANDFFQRDDSQTPTFIELASMEARTAARAIDELKGSAQTPEVESLRKAFETHEKYATLLHKSVEARDHDAVADIIDEMKTTFVRIKELIPVAASSQRTAGPTQSPQVNAVLSYTDDLIASRIQDIVLMNALEVLHKDFLAAKADFTRLTARPADSVLLNEELQRVSEAYELQELAFKAYSRFFAGRSLQVLERAKEMMKEAADNLYTCYQNLQTIAEREGKTLCIRCSHYNPAQRNHCEKCGMVLPSAQRDASISTFEAQEGEAARPATQSDGPVLTANMVRIYRAVDKVAEEQITDEEFLSELSWFEGVLRKNADYDKNQPDTSKMTDEEKAFHAEVRRKMKEIDHVFQEALAEFDNALASFRQFIETRDVHDLEDGVKLCDAAARKMVIVRDLPKTIRTEELPIEEEEDDQEA